MSSDDEKDFAAAGGQHRENDDDDDDDDDGPSSEASDSGSEDEDDGEKVSAQLEQLEAAVAGNPNSYEAHFQYVTALRKAGLLEKLRTAREAMNAVFPLTSSMWHEWCQDEARLASCAEDFLSVEVLYERGVGEYLSASLWVDYLEFVEENDLSVAQCTPPGITKMRALCERALAAAGLHFTEGGKVWEAYREFEQALLISMVEASQEAKSKQVEIVRSLFRRQLTVPLANHNLLLEEYKDWEQQQGVQVGDDSDDLIGLPNGVALAYKKAVQMCRAREPYEAQIASETLVQGDLLQHYLGYIALEEATGEPARAQILYERAVSEFPVTQDIWLKYTEYLDVNLKVASVIRKVYARAVRNCPWVATLWTKYMLALERGSAPETELAAVFEQALLSGFQTPNEYEEVFLTRAHGLRRRIMAAGLDADNKLDFAVLHQTFDRAAQFVAKYFPDFFDQSLRLPLYWTHLEAQVLKDVAAARGVWENLIKTHGRMPEVWLSYISMEILLGNVKETRAIYRRCYSRRLEGTGTEVLCRKWLQFEEEYGTLEDYDRAVLKVGPRVAEVQAMQHQQEQKTSQNAVSFLEEAKAQGAGERKSKTSKVTTKSAATKSADVHVPKSRKRGVGFSEHESSAKRQKGRTETNGPSGVKDTDHPMEQADVITGPSPEMEGGQEGTRKSMQSQSQSLNTAVVYTDQCTAFLSNLSFEATEEQIKEFFVSCGGVKDVRLLRDRATSRPRGLAYVEFEDEQSLEAAVAKNKEEFLGRPLSVARSDPKSGRSGGRGSGSVRGQGAAGGRGAGGRGGHISTGGRGQHNEQQGGGLGQAGPPMIGHRRGGHVKLTGTNTFAVPRTVARPLGWGTPHGDSSTTSIGDQAPKSNSEFRNMFLEKK